MQSHRGRRDVARTARWVLEARALCAPEHLIVRGHNAGNAMGQEGTEGDDPAGAGGLMKRCVDSGHGGWECGAGAEDLGLGRTDGEEQTTQTQN